MNSRRRINSESNLHHEGPALHETLEPRLMLSGTAYLVDSLGDVPGADPATTDGVITLREAIEAANTNAAFGDAAAGSDTETDIITFDQAALSAEAGVAVGEPVKIALGGAQLDITDDLEIQGLGADVLTVDASGGSRVFYISGAATEVELSGVTITGGAMIGHGGGIYNDYGILTLANSVISGNSTDSQGGGVYNLYGTVMLTNSVVSGNLAGSGGGIRNVDGPMTLTNVTVSGNYAQYEGGGINCYFGSLLLQNTIVAMNDAGADADLHGPFTSHQSLLAVHPGFLANPSAGLDGVWGTVDDDPGDLHLGDTSLAVDLGDVALAVDGGGSPLTVDVDGNPRVVNGQVDVGAYEYQGALSPSRESPSVVVTTLTDVVDIVDGEISLREALTYSSMLAQNVTFAAGLSGGTIALGGEELVIYQSSGIDATSIGGMTIDAGRQSRVMFVAGADTEVSLTELTLTGGGTTGDGGGIHNEGILTVTDSALSDNWANRDGGGIYSTGAVTLVDSTLTLNIGSSGGGVHSVGPLELIDSMVVDNLAHQYGGGLSASRGTVTLTNSTISGNTANDEGGGIRSQYNVLTLTGSTVDGNTAEDGAGIWADLATVTLTGSTVSGNIADLVGGGIRHRGGELTLSSTTLSGNEADSGGGIYVYGGGSVTLTDSTVIRNSTMFGGGIYNDDTTLTLMNAQIEGNFGGYGGGGIYNGSGTLTMTNSTVTGNVAMDGGGVSNGTGAAALTNSTVSGNMAYSQGGGVANGSGTLTLNNTIVALNDAPAGADSSGSSSSHNSLVGTDPLFVRNPHPGADGAWGTADDDYGDLRLLVGSPAIDAGDNALAVDGDGLPLATDIDGSPRVSGQHVDIGAHEYQWTPGDADQDHDVDLDDFMILKLSFGRMDATWGDGDFTADGFVDLDDFSALKTNFGSAAAAAAPVHAADDALADDSSDPDASDLPRRRRARGRWMSTRRLARSENADPAVDLLALGSVIPS